MILLNAAGKSIPHTNGYAQLITVLVVFVLVLGITAFVTKWMANYQKGQNSGRNVEVIETTRIANNKWLQIVRVGRTFKAIVVSRDNVTYLGDIDPSEIKTEDGRSASKSSFKSIIDKALNKDKNKVSSDDAEDDKE